MISIISSSYSFLKRILTNIFGKASWTPPTWILKSKDSVISCGILSTIAYLRLLEEKPRKFFLLNFLTLFLIASGIYGAIWYKNQPKPSTISFKTQPISATRLDIEPAAQPNPLAVEFSGSAAPLDKVGKELGEVIEITPKLKGSWKWINDSRLEFAPLQDWEVGQEYQVKFRKALFPRHIKLEQYEFTFSSPKFTPKIESGEFYEDPSNTKNKQAVVKLSFSHPVDKSDLERRVRIRMRVEPTKSFEDSDVKKLGYKIVYNDKSTEAYIRSDNLSIPARDGEILVEISPGLRSAKAGRAAESTLSRTIQIPGVENYFKITDLKQSIITNQDSHAAERILTIVSSAGVSNSELAKNVELLLLSNDPELYQSDNSEEEAALESEEINEDEAEDQYYEESDPSSYTPSLEENACPWKNSSQVPDQALKKAQPLNIEWIASEKDYSTENSFKFHADIGRCVFLRIKKGTKSFGDYPLVDTRSFVQIAQPFSQDLKITDKGSILALSGDKKIRLMSRGLKSIKFTLFRVLPNSLHHLSTQAYQYDSTFSQPNFNYNFGPENISEVFESIVSLPQEDPGKAQYSYFDFNTYIQNQAEDRGLFFLKANAYDPETKSTIGPRAERLVLVSNLGFIVKDQQDDSHQLYVMSSSTQSAVASAEVEVLGKNGLPIFNTLTNDLGRADLPSFKEYKFEKEPTLYLVRKDSEISFMPFNRFDRKLNFSRFETGGLYTEKASESLQAYIFSDRGIYRPGEEAQFGLIVKTANWSSLGKDTPLELSILDPRGIEIKKELLKFPSDGFREFKYLFSDSSLTGSYVVQISLVRPKKESFLLGSTQVRVEEFLPDRLKIGARFNKDLSSGWITPENLKVEVDLKNLYGTAAEGNKIKGKIRLAPTFPKFSGWENYTFFDPYSAKNSFNEDLGEQLSDNQGKSYIDLDLSRFEKATYQLSVFIQGLEKEGGRAVSTNLASLISPQTYLVGWKASGDLSFIKKNFTQKVKVVAVSQDLASIDADNLILERTEERYVSVLAKQPSGSMSYQSVKKKIVRDSKPFKILQSGTEIELPSDEPGSFYYEIRDAHGLVLNKIPFNIVGDANLNRSMERNAELQIKLNKKDYSSEEEIEFEVQAPYTGTGLVTIERDKVYAATWFKTDTNSSVQRIRLPKGIEGNAYLNVAFVRSLDSKEIYTSPLSYGVEAFSISKQQRTQKINLELPSEITPGSNLEIKVSSDKPTRAVIYAVDEGILQVARYKTPDPLSHFFRKRALEVQTQQIVDLLLPEYRILREVSAAGGDEDALLGKHKNPFKRKGQKPVIFWSQILNLNENPQNLSFEVPNYFNGSIKVFAVAVSDEKIGVTEKQVTVQGDLVLSPNAPLFASPGDEFEVSVVVDNIKSTEEDFKISIEKDASIELLSEETLALKIPKHSDVTSRFKLRAKEKLGNSEITFRATGAKADYRYSINMSIRPAAARFSELKSGVIKPSLLASSEKVIELPRQLFKEESEKSLSFSVLPLSLANGLVRYLVDYPHGCTEQVTSQAYPTLLFAKEPIFNLDQYKAKKSLQKAFAIQAARQKDDGSFFFWPGQNDAGDWLSLHIARFLLEAKELGYAPPKTLLENTKVKLRDISTASNSELSFEYFRNKAYAIYLLTRTGEVTSNYIQSLREELENSKLKNWRNDITSLFIASSYKLLQLDQEANDFASKVEINISTQAQDSETNPFYTNTSIIGLYLDLISRHFSDRAKNIKPELFESIANILADSQYSTVSSSNLMLGLKQYQSIYADNSIQDVAEVYGSSDGKNFAPLQIPSNKIPNLNISSDLISIKIINKGTQSVFYQLFESGFDKPNSAKEISNGIEISREYRNSKGEPITQANLGDDIDVVIGIRSKDKPWIDNIAVIDLLPSGLEISGGTLAFEGAKNIIKNAWSTNFIDAREDRALIYGSVTDSISQISFRAKAVSKGTFIVPGIQAEAMYEPKIIARASSSTFIVK